MAQPRGLTYYKAFRVFLGILNLILDIPPLLLLHKLRVLGNFQVPLYQVVLLHRDGKVVMVMVLEGFKLPLLLGQSHPERFLIGA
jgi:hypothetical protein